MHGRVFGFAILMTRIRLSPGLRTKPGCTRPNGLRVVAGKFLWVAAMTVPEARAAYELPWFERSRQDARQPSLIAAFFRMRGIPEAIWGYVGRRLFGMVQ
jgi:hypothetical protein